MDQVKKEVMKMKALFENCVIESTFDTLVK